MWLPPTVDVHQAAVLRRLKVNVLARRKLQFKVDLVLLSHSKTLMSLSNDDIPPAAGLVQLVVSQFL